MGTLTNSGKLIDKVKSIDTNVKTFYLSNSSSTTEIKEAYDWVSAGKEALIYYGGTLYTCLNRNSNPFYFCSEWYFSRGTEPRFDKYTSMRRQYLTLNETSIAHVIGAVEGTFIDPRITYGTPFEPTDAGHPATKKYVDDNLAAINGISTTQPSNPSTGSIYYDTTDNITKIYNGTSWEQLPTSDSVQSIIGANVAGYSSSSIGGSYRESNTTDYLLFTAPVSSTFFFMYTWSQNRSASLKFVTGSGTVYTPPQSTSGNNFYMITLNEGDTLYARIYVGGNGNYSASGYLTSYVVFGPS